MPSGGLYKIRSLLGKRVHAAMDVGFGMLIRVNYGIHHLARGLRSGRIVQIDEGTPLYLAAKYRKFGPQRRNIIFLHFLHN